MYAEELKQKPVSPIVGALITLGCVFGLLLCAWVVAFIQFWLQILWPEFIMYGVVIVGVIWAIRRFFTEYIYLIEKDRISFGRRIGKREKELLQVPLRDVIAIRPYDQDAFHRLEKDRKKFRFTFLGKSTWSVIECTSCVILVTCTEEYKERLRTAIRH
ncbi:MAG: hypothetical protein HDQ87_02740 [Clostridia bacterium]|nr:hypothetical protein [Clostridia bacterium]